MTEDLSRARKLDQYDPLGGFRGRFVIDDPDLIYLDGNSLGRLPKRTVEVLDDLIRNQWGQNLVGGWHEWYDLPQRLGAKIANLIGADADEVVVCDSTSVNLFKLTLAALARQRGRNKIVTDDANFPSDVYVTVGAAALTGAKVEMLTGEIGADVALLSLSHTAFKSGYMHDMASVTTLAHDSGALALWDLSHSVGGVPVDLHASNADLAVGCTYKYLNGGPGAPAFLYVRRNLQSELTSPIWGWFGQKNPFDFDLHYQPAEGLSRFLAGTPPILSMAAVEPGVDLILEANMDRIRKKSLAQTEFLIEGFDRHLAALGFELLTPRDPNRRGSHVSLAHPEAWRINQALIKGRKVIPDFRAPDVLRLASTPLYTTFEELALSVEHIREITASRAYERFSPIKSAVT